MLSPSNAKVESTIHFAATLLSPFDQMKGTFGSSRCSISFSSSRIVQLNTCSVQKCVFQTWNKLFGRERLQLCSPFLFVDIRRNTPEEKHISTGGAGAWPKADLCLRVPRAYYSAKIPPRFQSQKRTKFGFGVVATIYFHHQGFKGRNPLQNMRRSVRSSNTVRCDRFLEEGNRSAAEKPISFFETSMWGALDSGAATPERTRTSRDTNRLVAWSPRCSRASTSPSPFAYSFVSKEWSE